MVRLGLSLAAAAAGKARLGVLVGGETAAFLNILHLSCRLGHWFEYHGGNRA